MNIDRCYCFEVPFAVLKKVADTHNVSSLQELQELEEFGKRCALCHPYVREMLRSGKTEFDRIIEEDSGQNH